MTAQTSELTVRRTIVVAAPQQRAFEVFTTGLDRWWPREHHLNPAALAAAVMEPRAGGRWYERCADGSECDWGRVLVWEPPSRVVLSWQIDGEWRADPDPARASEIEVHFIVEAPGRTRVELEHRNFEHHGATADAVRKGVGSPDGWAFGLKRFATVAEKADR